LPLAEEKTKSLVEATVVEMEKQLREERERAVHAEGLHTPVEQCEHPQPVRTVGPELEGQSVTDQCAHRRRVLVEHRRARRAG
jgi:hypothetical protein